MILKLFIIVLFTMKFRIEKNNIMKVVENRGNDNDFFYLSFLYKKIGLYRK